MMYTVRLIKNRGKEVIYSCTGVDISVMPDEGPFKDKYAELGLPDGQEVKLVLEPKHETLYLPRDGKEIYITTESGKPVDHFPRRKKELRVVNKESGE